MKLLSCLIVCAVLLPWNAAISQTVVLPKSPNPGEQKAAAELALHLGKALDERIEIKAEGESVSGPLIYVGRTEFAAKNGVKLDGLNDEAWLLKANGGALIAAGGSGRGTLYAAYELLERYAGVVWTSETFTYIPKMRVFKWPADLNLSGQPSFPIRGIYAYHINPAFPRREFMARNRLNFFLDEHYPADLKIWDIDPIYGSPRECHTYYNYTKDLTDADIELFSMEKDGKRVHAKSAYGPGQVCFTNPKMRRHFIDRLKYFIEKDKKDPRFAGMKSPWLYEVSANDNGSYCNCPDCLAAAKKYGAYSGVVIEFTNAIAEAIVKEYPNVYIQMFAYSFSVDPPAAGSIKVHPHVYIRLAQSQKKLRDQPRKLSHPNNENALKHLREWHTFGNLSIWDYASSYHRQPELSDFSYAIAENYRTYYENNVKAVFSEVDDIGKSVFFQLRMWMAARFSYNVHADADKEIDRFMNAYYGTAKPAMKELLLLINKTQNAYKGNLMMTCMRSRSDLDAGFFAKVDKLFDKANAAAAGDQQSLNHIAEERAYFDVCLLQKRKTIENFNMAQVAARLKKNYPFFLRTFTSAANIPAKMKEYEAQLESLTVDLPQMTKYEGKKVYTDLGWPDFNARFHNSKIERDPDAHGGFASILYGDKFKAPLVFGYYDSGKTGKSKVVKIVEGKIPQDEKFHFYDLGKVTLAPYGYLWTSPTWEIQRDMGEFYCEGKPNDYRIIMSIKLQGPGYVKGSTKPTAVMMDRILIVMP